MTPASRALAQRLPVPVVGVPWFQLYHLPDALVIGHEVGHLVERDTGLTATIQELVERAVTEARMDPGCVAAWRGWAAEAFADVYGTLGRARPSYARFPTSSSRLEPNPREPRIIRR